MKNLLTFSSFLIIISACSNSQEAKNYKSANETISVATSKLTSSVENIDGVWQLENDEMTSLEIRKDTIFYPDQQKQYVYKITKDSICIYYEGWIYKAKYTLDKNKLILSDSSNTFNYIKVN